MRGLTSSESLMMHYLGQRLGGIPSPVVRSQLLLQMSQLIDVVLIGDTSSLHEKELLSEIDDLSHRLLEQED